MVDADRSAMDRAAAVVRDVLRRQFDELRVARIAVEEGYDADGDPVLDIAVVYEPDGGKPDIAKVVGFVRHLRPELSQIGENRFPVISYIPVDEYAETA